MAKSKKTTTQNVEEVMTEESVNTATISTFSADPVAVAPMAAAVAPAAIIVEEDDVDFKIPDSISINKKTLSLSLDENQTDTLTATLSPENSDGIEESKWSATPDNIVDIDPKTGAQVTITPKASGQATVKVELQDVDDECVVTVTSQSQTTDPEEKEEPEVGDTEMTEYEKLNTVEARRSTYQLSESVEKTVNGKEIPSWAKKNKYRIKKVLKDRAIVRAGLTYSLALKADDISVVVPTEPEVEDTVSAEQQGGPKE